MSNAQVKETQTDEDLIYNYAWSKFYYHFQNHANSNGSGWFPPQSHLEQTTKKVEENKTYDTKTFNDEKNSEKLDVDIIRKIAEESMAARGLHYESTTGLYYDSHQDLFYDQDTQLYLDIVNRINYKFVLNERTSTYHLRYASKMNRKTCNRLRKYLERSELFEREELKSKKDEKPKERELEEGEETNEISYENSSSSSTSSSRRQKKSHKKKLKKLHHKKHKRESTRRSSKDKELEKDDDQEVNRNTSSDYSTEIFDLSNQYPPCVRAILTRTSPDNDNDNDPKLGSLFLVPFTGGLVGTCISKCIISFPKAKDIEKEHAKIKYDKNKKTYLIQDLNSKLGTYLNGIKLESCVQVEMKHGDRVGFGEGSFELLVHIHSGSLSCSSCEPGEVMSQIKQQQEKERLLEKKDASLSKDIVRKETLKIIKKKYGLMFNDFDAKTSSTDVEYKDRAAERRSQFGVDSIHLELKESSKRACVSVAIEESNIGRKMLQKMGWKQGQGLGKKKEGITDPIAPILKLDKSGLGSGKSTECSLDLDERHKQKLVALKKTQERYQASEGDLY